MTSLFKLFAQSCGLPLHEVSVFLGTKPETTRSWWLGRRKPPESILEKLVELSVQQDIAAQELLHKMELMDGSKENRITVKVYNNDTQAQAVGWPSANAYRAVIRKAVEKMPSKLATQLILVNSKDEVIKT